MRTTPWAPTGRTMSAAGDPTGGPDAESGMVLGGKMGNGSDGPVPVPAAATSTAGASEVTLVSSTTTTGTAGVASSEAGTAGPASSRSSSAWEEEIASSEGDAPISIWPNEKQLFAGLSPPCGATSLSWGTAPWFAASLSCPDKGGCGRITDGGSAGAPCAS